MFETERSETLLKSRQVDQPERVSPRFLGNAKKTVPSGRRLMDHPA